MATRNRLNVEGAGMPRMERTEIWLGGYHAAMTNPFAGELDITDDQVAVYGFDATIDNRAINAGTLTLTEYEHPTLTSDVLDVLYNVDPTSAGIRGYKATGSFTVDVVRLTKHPNLTHYIKAELFKAWNCVLRPAQGAPKEHATRVLDGRCGLPIEFRVKDVDGEAVAIAFDVAVMASGSSNMTGALGSNTGAAAVTAIPDNIPNAQELVGKFALLVEAQKRSGGKITKSARLTVTSSMVDASGNITIVAGDIASTAFTQLSDITHAWVVFLLYHTGSALNTNKLLGDGINVRGRFDTVP